MSRTEACSTRYNSDLREIFDYIKSKEASEISYIKNIEKQSALIDKYEKRIKQLEDIETKYKRCCTALDIISHIIVREETKSRTTKLIKELKQILMENVYRC